MKTSFVCVLLFFVYMGKPEIADTTLSDIFVKIPDVYFESFRYFNANSKPTMAIRKKLLNEKKTPHLELFEYDLKNGYLNFGTNGDGSSLQATITYWRFGNSILVGLVIDEDGNCTNFSKQVFFLEYSNGKFNDVTKLFNPKLNLMHFDISEYEVKERFEGLNSVTIWKLPQKGKTIKISPFFYVCGGSDRAFEGSPVYYDFEPTSIKTFKITKKYGKNPNE